MANTDYGAIPLTLAEGVSQKLNQKLGVTTGFKPSEWADAINLLGRLPNKTVSGSICHFTDGVNVPLVNGKFGITAYQDGTGIPSPSNVRAIHGYTGMDIVRTGKNLFNGENATSGYFINSSGTTQSSSDWTASDYIHVPSNTELYFNPNTTSGSSAKHAFYDANKNFISVIASGSGTFTTPVNCVYMRFSYRSTSEDIQIELGSSATAYSAYNGTTYPLTWQTECYGGYIDYKRGKKVSTHGKVDLSQTTWVYQDNYLRFSSGIIRDTVAPPSANAEAITGALCSLYAIATSNNTASSYYDNVIAVSSTGNVQIRDTSLNGDIDDLKERLANSVFVYPLANPIEEDITLPVISLLEGENNIWNTCGDSEVTYIASSAKTGINFSADVNSGWSATDATRTMMTITASGDAQIIFGKGATGITNCSNNHAYMKLIKNSTEIWTKTLPQNTTTNLDDIPDISLADGDQLKLVFGYASTHSNVNMHFNNGYLQIAGNADVKGLAGVSNTYLSLIGVS